MNENSISDIHATRMLILFLLGSSLALHNATDAGRNNWIAVFIAMIFSIFLFYIYSYMLNLIKDATNFYDLHTFVYGKYIGIIINILYMSFPLYLGATIIREYGEYSRTVSLPRTPLVVPLIFMGILCIWIVKCGLKTLGRWSNLFFFIDAPLPTILFILTIPLLNIENILPILYNGIKPILKGTFYSTSVPFGEGIVFLLTSITLSSKSSHKKVFRNSIIISGLTLVGVCLIEILILGYDMYDLSLFPAQTVAKKISIGTFIERLEPLVLISTTTAAFVKVSLCLFATVYGISYIFKIKNTKLLAFPCGFLMIALSYILHDNILDLMDMYLNYKSYYSAFFCLVIPSITLIILLFKVYILKKKTMA
ncbi:endospore germination permease [Clostridiaceae bacterium M8S5]|nr:endospore germination permease [Clostridiaceae bacterium M8S5]